MMTASDGDFIRNGGTCSRTKGEMNFEEKQFRQPCIIGWATIKEAASSPLSSFCATKKSTVEEQFHLHNEVPAKQLFSDTQQDHKMHIDENMYSLEGHDDFDQVVNECFSNLDDDSNDNSKIQEDDKTEHHPPFLCSPTPFRSDQHQNNTHTIVMVSDARSEQSVPSCEPPHSESLCPSDDAIRIFQLDHNADMKPHGGTFQVQPRRHSMPLTPSFFGKQQENQDSEVFHDGDSHNTNMVDLHNKKFIHVEEDVMLLNESHDHHEPLHREEIDTPIIMDGNSSSSSSQGSRTYSNCTADSQLHRYYYGCPSAKVGVESPWNEQDSVANSPPESMRLTTVDNDEEAPPVIPPNNGDHHHGHTTTPEERRRMDHPKDHPCGASTITTTSNRKVERRGSLPSSFVYMDHPPNANHKNTSTSTIHKTSVDTCPSTTFPDSKKEAVIGAPHPLSQKAAIKLATFFPEEPQQNQQDLYCHQQQEEEEQQQQYPLVMVDHHHNHHHHDPPQPPCHHHTTNQDDDNKRMTMTTTMMDLDDYGLTTKYRVLMRKSSMSQRALQAWDKSMGLPKNHSPAMVNSSKSRQQLQEGIILTTYRGTPLTERISMASSNHNHKTTTKMKRRVTSPY